METWNNFKAVIKRWTRMEMTDEEFYYYLTSSTFENDIDTKLADTFIKQHDAGEWDQPVFELH